MPKVHELKTWPVPFAGVKSGKKRFEIRKDSRDYKSGDELLLREFVPAKQDKEAYYTGQICHRIITHILRDFDGIQPGYCILSIDSI